ncbi:hypothetical protein M422DRAFT_266169 [Sphaerobolus stellatus SS14]|uniref:Uncharacterized protein n=1 Tax=Sphaerobolus stellatus (strain SS14) TaxID=990650 RepID=A0A0C9V3R2_SPHS4|nr:hypothetical protein M422DRAFT_266169 [Sphaerobolus stellatus SS14]
MSESWRSSGSVNQAKSQLRYYLEVVRKKTKDEKALCGILVVGPNFWVFNANSRQAPHPGGRPHSIWPTLKTEMEKRRRAAL